MYGMRYQGAGIIFVLVDHIASSLPTQNYTTFSKSLRLRSCIHSLLIMRIDVVLLLYRNFVCTAKCKAFQVTSEAINSKSPF